LTDQSPTKTYSIPEKGMPAKELRSGKMLIARAG